MVRLACATVVALFLVVAPARAAFQTCTYDAGTHVATATFGNGLQGQLRQVGTQIQADGVACGAATTANTDTIKVVGDEADQEQVVIDLSGGTFTGGFTDETGTSDEVEIEVDLKGGFADPGPDAFIVGTSNPDHITVGMLGFFDFSAVNLNANETTGIDPDVTFTDERLTTCTGTAGQMCCRRRVTRA